VQTSPFPVFLMPSRAFEMTELSKSYCVIGDPVGHSVSPRIHHYIHRVLGLDLNYDAVHVTPDSLPEFVHEAAEKGRPGFNVTIPHKEKIIPLLDEIDPLVDRVGAVNTIKNQDGRLIGFNTDISGFRSALSQERWVPHGDGVIMGAGGAARAAVETLNSLGLRRIFLLNRTPARAERLKKDFEAFPSLEIIVGSLENDDLERFIHGKTILINATPMGMWPHVDESPLKRPDLITPETTVFDMVPRPIHTKLLLDARSRGAKTISGLRMLVAQAVAAEEIWLDRRFENKLNTDLFEYMINEMENDG